MSSLSNKEIELQNMAGLKIITIKCNTCETNFDTIYKNIKMCDICFKIYNIYVNKQYK